MKQVMIAVLTILSLLMAGCADQQYTCDDGSTAGDASQCSINTDDIADEPAPSAIADIDESNVKEEDVSPPATDEVEEEEFNVVDEEDEPLTEEEEDMYALLDLIKSDKPNGFSYTYYGPGRGNDHYLIRGDAIKIELFELEYYQENPLSVLYGKLSSGVADGYCEDVTKGVCTEPNAKVTVERGIYMSKTPLEWIDEITWVKQTGSETIDNRNALITEFKTDDLEGTVWIEEYYGIPMRVKVGETTYDYRFMKFSVDKTDMEHQYIPEPDTV